MNRIKNCFSFKSYHVYCCFLTLLFEKLNNFHYFKSILGVSLFKFTSLYLPYIFSDQFQILVNYIRVMYTIKGYFKNLKIIYFISIVCYEQKCENLRNHYRSSFIETSY